MKRLPYQPLTPEQQRQLALHASEHGVARSAETHNVSVTAVRRACAVTGVAPKRMHGADTKPARVRTALSLLKSLRLTPQDLIQ